MRILVVDKSDSIRGRLRELLRETREIDVREAGDGHEALAQVASTPADVVLLDIAFGPSVNSGGALGLIDDLKRRAPLALLIVLTNHSSEAHRQACLQHGADHFFDKSRQFERAVEVALERLGRA